MARVIIRPVSRSVPPGSKVTFAVRVEGSEAATLAARPCDEAGGYEATFGAGEREVAVTGEEQILTITVPPGASMA